MSQSSTRNLGKELNKLTPEGKTLLSYLKVELSTLKQEITEQLSNEFLKMKEDLVKKQAGETKVLKEKVAVLEQELSASLKREDDANQYSRKDSVIISGPALPQFTEEENTSEVVQKLLRDHLNITVTDTDISTTHRLGPLRSSTPGKRNIYVKLVRRDTKKLIISSCKAKKNGQLFANESLSPVRRKLFTTLRKMKKDVPALVKGASTLDGKVYAYTPPINGNTRDQRHLISDWDVLKDFCRQYVKQPLDSFLQHNE